MRRRDPIRSRRRVRFSFASNRCSVWGMKLIPLNDKVLVLPVAAESKTPGGIIIPGTAEGKPTRGRVIAIGANANEKLGAEDIPVLVEGVEVMFPTYGGVEVDVDGTKHRLIPAEELLGVIEAGA